MEPAPPPAAGPPTPSDDADDPSVSETRGSPVGRRVVLGMLGIGAVGVVAGSRVNSALATLSANDPTGLSGYIPGSGRFRFYSVAGRVSEIAPASFGLDVSGMVAHPQVLTMAALSTLPQTEITCDVQCVTGWRVPRVRWSGVLLADILDHVGAGSEASALRFGSADGVYSESLTMEQARRPDVLVATSMDGSAISNNHGGPVRLYVAPMYFYKSVKWLDSITVTDKVIPGYWEHLGYDVDAWVGDSNGRSDAPTT